MTAYAAAHDLRAPVRHIKAWAKAVLDIEADVLSDEGIEKLDAIEASTTRMEQLIRSLLGFCPGQCEFTGHGHD